MDDKETARDLLSNGFIKVFDGIRNFHYINDEATWGWVRTIMVNECLAFLRKKKKLVLRPLDNMPPASEGVDDDPLHQITFKEIIALIIQLPLPMRTVFNLFHFDGYSHAQIAGSLGLSEAASRTILLRARNSLKAMLNANDKRYETSGKR